MISPEYGNTDAKLVPASLIGYRAWKPVISHPGLRSYVRGYEWHPGSNQATCVGVWLTSGLAVHNSPSKECSCGFYGRLDNDQHGYGGDAINGVVEVSGRVILGTKGFRAERAQIKALFLTPDSTAFFRRNWGGIPWAQSFLEGFSAISDKYGIPVFNSFQEAKAAFPPSDVSELMPAVSDDRESYWVGGTPHWSWTAITGGVIRVTPLNPDGSVAGQPTYTCHPIDPANPAS